MDTQVSTARFIDPAKEAELHAKLGSFDENAQNGILVVDDRGIIWIELDSKTHQFLRSERENGNIGLYPGAILSVRKRKFIQYFFSPAPALAKYTEE